MKRCFVKFGKIENSTQLQSICGVKATCFGNGVDLFTTEINSKICDKISKLN